jgi:cytochrome c oxidase subunit 4
MSTHDEPHITPLWVYHAVYLGLMVLTVVTVGVSRLDLGAASIYPAMGVAIMKAGLVVAFFMHLKQDGGFLNVIFFTSIFFIGLFFLITMSDLGARDLVVPEHGNHLYKEQHNLVVDAPATLTEEGHDLPAAYVNEELSKKLHGDSEHHGGGDHHGEEHHGSEGEPGAGEGGHEANPCGGAANPCGGAGGAH